jgi:hypothetical protein
MRIEMTDTFGGESNYSWVKRVEVELPESCSNRQKLALVREALELPTGLKLRLNFDSHGLERYDVVGSCVCIFLEHY